MTDLIIGLGEVGTALYQLLEEREIQCETYDNALEPSRLVKNDIDISPEFMHVCIPYNDNFTNSVIDYIDHFIPKAVILHSTVPVGTTAIIARHIEGKIPIFYSPIRGVHERLLLDLKRYQKFIAPQWLQCEEALALRFVDLVWVGSTDALELTKLMETTYYGYLIAFRKDVDKKFVDMKLDPEVFWTFCEEVHEYLTNRPVMFNDGEPIGGHCVIPNLKLLPDNFEMYKGIVGKWAKKD